MAQSSVSKKELNSDKRSQNSKSRDSIATEVKRSFTKTDGKAKVLGVASVATLLRPDRHVVPSARIPHAGPSMKRKKSSIAPAARSNLTCDGDTPPIVTEDRSHMLKLAGQAIASSSCDNTVYEHEDAVDNPSSDHIQKMRSLVPPSKQDQSAARTLHTGYPLKRAAAVTGSEIVNKAASVMSPTTSDSALRNELRSMVLGLTRYDRESQKLPGNYLAIDCEMVGLGYNGEESCLARVSIVNYHGYIVLDTFVRPKEKVTDWRTWVSGVRPQDMQHAPSFETVQTEVAKLLEGKIVIGHAVENDTKALLLSHPSPLLRDTQRNTALRQIAKTKMPGLKKLTELELGLKIQSGAHSSVTDARATMALYRLHKAEWEQQMWKETQAYLARQKRGNGAQLRPSKSTADTSLLDKPLIAAESRPRKRKDSSEPAGVSKRTKVQGMPSRGLGHANWWED